MVTPLKDRIGSEIRTHYPQTRQHAIAITRQEAWVGRDGNGAAAADSVIPAYVREIVEEIAFQARADQKVDRRSGVSQRLPITCLENVVSNAERRALMAGEDQVVARVTDIYAALPSITGKFELEYEGELKGADNVARDLIRSAVSTVFAGWFDGVDCHPVVEWFEMGGSLQVGDITPVVDLLQQVKAIQGLRELAKHTGVKKKDPPAARAAAVDFVLEGLYAQKKISRTDEWEYRATDPPRPTARATEQFVDPNVPQRGSPRSMVHPPWLLSFPRAFVLTPRTSPFVLPGLNLTVMGGLGQGLFIAALRAPEPPAPLGWLDVMSFFARLLVFDANVFHEVSASAAQCLVRHGYSSLGPSAWVAAFHSPWSSDGGPTGYWRV